MSTYNNNNSYHVFFLPGTNCERLADPSSYELNYALGTVAAVLGWLLLLFGQSTKELLS